MRQSAWHLLGTMNVSYLYYCINKEEMLSLATGGKEVCPPPRGLLIESGSVEHITENEALG